jgi:hypothetical protein
MCARVNALLLPLAMLPAIGSRRLSRPLRHRFDQDEVLLVLGMHGALQRVGDAVGELARDLEVGFGLTDLDGANLVARDVTATADKRQ